MFTRDIHHGHPTVDVAMYSLDMALKAGKQCHEKIMEIIVGYGSSGGTHKIKTAVLEKLELLKTNNQIKDFIIGDEIDIFNQKYQNFAYRDLIPKDEKVKKNKGSIFIVL